MDCPLNNLLLMLTLADREYSTMYAVAVDLLNTEQLDHRDAAQKLWERYASLAYPNRKYDILARLYMASAGVTWN